MLVFVCLTHAAQAREVAAQLTANIGAYTSEKVEVEALVSGSITRTQAVAQGPVTIVDIVSPASWNPIAKQLIANGVPVREDGVPYSTWLVKFRTQDGRMLWGEGDEVYVDCLGGELVTGPHAPLQGCGHTPALVPALTIWLTVTSACPGTKRMADAAQQAQANTVESARRWMELASKIDPCGRNYVSTGNKQQAAIVFGKEAMFLGWAADELYHTDHRSSGRQILDSAKSKFAYAKSLAGSGLASMSLGEYYQSGIMPAEQDYEP